MHEELVKDLREKAEFLTAAEPLHIKNAFAETMKQAADAIEELSKLRWIPVTERLPKEKYAVLVWVPKYRNHYVCFISDSEWYLYGGHNVIVVGATHWMPLPEPPKEEE